MKRWSISIAALSVCLSSSAIAQTGYLTPPITGTVNSTVTNGFIPDPDANGTPSPTALQDERSSKVYIKDYMNGSTLTADGFNSAAKVAANTGKELVSGGAINLVANKPLIIYQNMNADLKQMTISPDNVNVTSGCLVTMQGAVGSKDFGIVRGLRLAQTLTSNHADITKTVDGLCIGNGTDYVRYINFPELVITGFREAVKFQGSNVFILDFDHANISKNWSRGFDIVTGSNSNERIAIHNSTLGNMENPSANGTIFYVDPTTSSPDIYVDNSSLDYSDYVAQLNMGILTISQSHLENNSMNPMFVLNYTASKPAPDLSISQSSMGTGPGFSAWTGAPVTGATDRPCLIKATNGRARLTVTDTHVGQYELVNNEQMFCTDGQGTQQVKFTNIIQEAGYSTTAGQPTGVSPVKNSLYMSPTLATTGWTTSSGFSASSNYFLPGETYSFQDTQSTATTNFLSQTVPTSEGEMWTAEVYTFFPSYTSGMSTLRFKFYDGTGSNLVQDQIIAGGLKNASPISATTATITVPNATYPNICIFTPGTTQQGTFLAGMALSWSGATSAFAQTYLTKDNGDGTFGCWTGGGAVAATTFYGWTRVAAQMQTPTGATQLQLNLYGASDGTNGVVGTFYDSKPRLQKN